MPVPAVSGELGGNGKGKEKEVAEDPHKDYIHVRARRGQATDSHSLAERVWLWMHAMNLRVHCIPFVCVDSDCHFRWPLLYV